MLVLASANERDGISTVMEEDVEEGEEEIPPVCPEKKRLLYFEMQVIS